MDSSPFEPTGTAVAGREVQALTAGHPAIVDGETDSFPTPFATADDPVDVGFGDALELAQQEIVQALTGRLLADGHDFDTGTCGRRFAPYNVFH